jgi:hypothetical protein
MFDELSDFLVWKGDENYHNGCLAKMDANEANWQFLVRCEEKLFCQQ